MQRGVIVLPKSVTHPRKGNTLLNLWIKQNKTASYHMGNKRMTTFQVSNWTNETEMTIMFSGKNWRELWGFWLGDHSRGHGGKLFFRVGGIKNLGFFL